MDNDNKIDEVKDVNKEIEDLHKQVMLFLGDEVDKIHQKSSNNSYDMEKEYAKTKRNHSPVNFLVLFGSFLIVIGTVFFINKYISVKDEEITVSLDEFEDLNLNNLLNTVATAQMNYDTALEKKHTIEAEMEAKLNALKNDLDNELFVLDSLNLSDKAEYRRRKSKAQSKYNSAVAEVKGEYESQILLATKQVDAYKEQLDEFDSVKVANAQEREKLINSERQLRKLEIDKVTNSYEARIENLNKAMDNIRVQSSKEMRDAVNNVATKYQAEIDALDPKLTDIKANLILSTVEAGEEFNGPFKLVSANIDDPDVVKSVKKYQNLYDDYKYLDDVVRSIPQKNSIPSYNAATRGLVNNMSTAFINSSMAYYNHIVEQRNEISGLNNTIVQQQKKYETDMAAEKAAHEKAMSDAKTAHENAMAAAQQAHKTELANTTAAYESKIKTAKETYAKNIQAEKTAGNSSLSAVFNALGLEAMVVNAAGYENIQVAVVPEKRHLISATGVGAEIKTEPPIKGKIVPGSGYNYFFEVEKDEAGVPAEVNFETLVPGTEIIFPVEVAPAVQETTAPAEQTGETAQNAGETAAGAQSSASVGEK